MTQTATPGKGCYTASYPTMAWRKTACAKAPTEPLAPRTATAAASVPPAADTHAAPSVLPETVGGSKPGDFSATVSGLLTGVTGSFSAVSGVTSETDGGVANKYSLQLNSQPFDSPVCQGHAGCQGWEQFAFTNSGSGVSLVFVQFWILDYFTTCPQNWEKSGNDCFVNGPTTSVASQPITNLANLSLTGTANSSQDTAIIATGDGSLNAATAESSLGLSAAWTTAEFMIGGYGNASQAVFNGGSTITVKTVVHNGSTAAPTCLRRSFTGESNNLNLVGTPTITAGAAPSIESVQSNVLTTPASCAAAEGIGDTHLRTFGGTYYDFQAAGTFTLAQTSTMTVQANQVSGSPFGWPGTAVDNAVATRMGSDTVAVCGTGADPLVVDGSTTTLASGGTITLPSGIRIVRTDSRYVVTDPQGDSLTAVVDAGTVDVYVGLGTFPEPVSGLLANAPGTADKLKTSTGTVINTPVDLATLYNVYGDTWRVPAAQSLVAVCGGQTPSTNPTSPFWADQLPPDLHDPAQVLCQGDGITDPTLLEACTLDVAVLGNGAAAKFAGEPAPVNVAFSQDTAGSPGGETVAIRLPTVATDRYVRLNFTANSSQNAAQAAEFAVYDTAYRNLAANTPTTASTVTAGHTASNAADGDTATYWQGATGSWPTTLTTDLGRISPLTSVSITLPAGWPTRTQTLSVQGSTDGTDWTTLVPAATYTWDSAHSTGDTHLRTFEGTYYDFQATGAFTLAQSSSMTVQSNQVSGASYGWPNTAVDNAVATRMGTDTVTVCGSGALVVNGNNTVLAPGETITLPSGDRIVRTGRQYAVTDPQGDSLTAVVNAGYVDTYVGLGTYPEPVSGLLANAAGTTNKLKTATGTLLTIPLDFTTLYNVYGDSWRVPADQSLVAVCGGQTPNTNPPAPFWAGQLPPTIQSLARALCQSYGITDPTLLDACTLDAAVLGPGGAAQFIGEPTPANVAFSRITAGENVVIRLPAGITDRYVRLAFTANSSQNGAQAAEFAVYDTAYRNLAINAPTTAGSTAAGHTAPNAVDGNVNSYWQGTADTWPTSLTTDLGRINPLTSVAITLPPGWATRTQALSVQGSTNGTNWTTLVPAATYVWSP